MADVFHQGAPWFIGLGFYAFLLAAFHVGAPRLRAWLKERGEIVSSLGGGMALGYVFLHLIPELDEGHALFGRMIYVIPVAAFVLFYGMRKYLTKRRGESGNFPVALGVLCVYNALIVYGTPASVVEAGALNAAPLFIALGVHLVHADFSMGREHPGPFDRWGRYLLAIAPVAGWLTIVATQKSNEAVNDIFVALLAGALLYTIFAEELPDANESRYGWFVAGVLLFVAAAAPSTPR